MESPQEQLQSRVGFNFEVLTNQPSTIRLNILWNTALTYLIELTTVNSENVSLLRQLDEVREELERTRAERDKYEYDAALYHSAFHEVCADVHEDDATFQDYKQKYLDCAKAEMKMLEIIVPIAVAELEKSMKSENQ